MMGLSLYANSVSRGRPDLRFTSAEWSAFTAGVRHGEFDS
jgi:hypothetical protein